MKKELKRKFYWCIGILLGLYSVQLMVRWLLEITGIGQSRFWLNFVNDVGTVGTDFYYRVMIPMSVTFTATTVVMIGILVTMEDGPISQAAAKLFSVVRRLDAESERITSLEARVSRQSHVAEAFQDRCLSLELKVQALTEKVMSPKPEAPAVQQKPKVKEIICD